MDDGLGRALAALTAAGGAMIVTADHGNCEMMVDPETGGRSYRPHHESGSGLSHRRTGRCGTGERPSGRPRADAPSISWNLHRRPR